ncbi:DUF5825 family protein [Streptomyces sp. NPDC049813]|uniref:DUF5825 family protein n=1 Tax=Streptomyces sp. NPDC049813 TaxID=3365597 RepID=UPI0037BDD031
MTAPDGTGRGPIGTRPPRPDARPLGLDIRPPRPDARPSGPDTRPSHPHTQPTGPTVLPPTVPHHLTGTDVHVTEPLQLPLRAGADRDRRGDGGHRGDGRAATQAVQFLRECLSHGLRVTYDVRPGTYNLRALRHLPPPAERPAEAAELTAWRAGHAYGMLYHRRGPDFVTVMDRRERPASLRFTLDHPDLLSAFDALHEAMPLDALPPVQREAADLLAAERLALIVDGWAVALPPRLRRWPVPCTGI